MRRLYVSSLSFSNLLIKNWDSLRLLDFAKLSYETDLFALGLLKLPLPLHCIRPSFYLSISVSLPSSFVISEQLQSKQLKFFFLNTLSRTMG